MRRFALLLMLSGAAFMLPGCATQEPERRLIILGFDGADPELTERWMAEGKLPNLKRLSEEGAYRHLSTSNPAQSPTAWACFATGLNPGRTGIFGFLRRVNTAYGPMPEITYVRREWKPVLGFPYARSILALAFGFAIFTGVYVVLAKEALVGRAASFLMAVVLAVGGSIALNEAFHEWLPDKVVKPASARQGEDFWKLLGEQGIPTKVICAPLSFPAKTYPNCKLLSGLGTPDIKGTHGTWTVYSSESAFRTVTETGGVVLPVKISRNRIFTTIPGPDNPLVVEKIRRLQQMLASPNLTQGQTQRLQTQLAAMNARRETYASLRIYLGPHEQKAYLRIGWSRCSVKVGEWSRWMKIAFRPTPLITIRGMVRFYLASLSPKFELYMTPIAFDPRHVPPGIEISSPRSFSKALAKEVGPYDTLGWSAPTNPLKDGKLDDSAFIKYIWDSLQQRRMMVMKELEKKDWACFCVIFEEPDHVSHMMWRFEDKTHPMYNASAATKYGGELLKVYQYLDRIVGEVRSRFLDGRTALIVLSDHGFKSFRKSVNINNWLVEHGYLALRKPSVPMKLADLSEVESTFFNNVDWSRTRAYSMDLGKIFINLRGREAHGIVAPGREYEDLCREIAAKFQALSDPQTGASVVHKVYRREEIYRGPLLKHEADLIVGFNAGYRVSWQTCLGGMGQKVIEENCNPWSGDHCSLDHSQVPGVFFSDRKIDREEISIMDIAPAVLQYFNVNVKGELDGKAFSLVRR